MTGKSCYKKVKVLVVHLWTRKQTNFAQVLHYAQICRVQKVITPSLEALL
jgi:hypothetical protein